MKQKVKCSTLKDQRLNAELGLIIDEFSRAMGNADHAYIAYHNENYIAFTTNMWTAWDKYVDFCRRNSYDK
jgi:hypothetical protein